MEPRPAQSLPGGGRARRAEPAGLGSTPLLGREPELSQLADRLSRVGDRGGGVLLSGDPGIGKSALLRWAAEAAAATGMQTLTTGGTPSETGLPFAGLHQILSPLSGEVAGLPERQRRALMAAFGVGDDSAPELFLVALAALNLLSEASTRTPVLLLVDDAHWLDWASADVLAFVARRLESEAILLIAAIRQGIESVLDQVGLLELRLEPLDPPAASALLDASTPHLSEALRERLLSEAAGNPLALVELPVGVRELHPGSSPPPRLPLTARLERAFSSRLGDLPEATRTLLLVAALNDGTALSETLAAARTLLRSTPVVEDLAPAVAARLVELDDAGLRFRHPLMRSAIYQGATAAQRRAAHAALADHLEADADRRAWHRAAACGEPDEEVAAELEEAAARARRRGDISTALRAMERAAGLTVDAAVRGRRLLSAADLADDLGQVATLLRLVGEAERFELTPQQRTVVAVRRAMFDPAPVSEDLVRDLVATAERAARSGDVDLALELLMNAAAKGWYFGMPWEDVRERITGAAEALPLPETDPRVMFVMAMGATIERGAVVIGRLRQCLHGSPKDGTTLLLLGQVASLVGPFDLAIDLLGDAAGTLRAQGRLGTLALTLNSLGWTAYFRGDLRLAVTAGDESLRLAQESGLIYLVAQAQVDKALVDVVRGDLGAALAAAEGLERGALPIGASAVLAQVQLVRGLADLGAGRPADAYAHLRRIFAPGDPAHHDYIGTLAVADLVEASVRGEMREDVRPLVAHLEDLLRRTASPVLYAGLVFARPLLAADAAAEGLFRVALGGELAGWPLLRARSQLAYGQWLRRQRRIAESRAPLRAAAATLDALGARWWSEGAHRELRASGETSRRRSVHEDDRLTPQELQIAQLAADGLSNREIAETLYISSRTVSTHLYRIFPKLNLSSRTELAVALDRELLADTGPATA